MGRWQMTEGTAPFHPTLDPEFDDGRLEDMGEEGFTEELVQAHVADLAAGDGRARGYNYIGRSWPPVEEPTGEGE